MMQKPVLGPDVSPVAAGPERESQIDVFAIARVIWRGKLWIALVAALCLAIAWFNVSRETPTFTATTQMALEINNPTLPDIQAVISGFSGDVAEINTEMAVITSGAMVGLLVDELDLTQDPEFNGYIAVDEEGPGLLGLLRGAVGSALALLRSPEEAEEEGPPPTPEEIRQGVVGAVQGSIATENNYDTYVFDISVTTTDPEKSVLMANTLARLYRDDQIRTKVEVTERLAAWLSDRVGELRADLDQRESELADLRSRNALVSEEGLQAVNEQAIELRSELQSAQGQLARANERLAAMQAAAESGDTAAKVEAAEDGQLEAAAALVASSEEGGQLRFDRRFAQLLLQVEADRDRTEEQVEELQRSVDELSAQFESQSADLRALQEIEQEAEATRALYQTFLSRLRETSVQESVHEADSRILTEASDAFQVTPRPSRTMMIALLLGLILGTAAVLVREFMQNTFRTAEDLEAHTGRAVLGQIPRIPASSRTGTVAYLRSKPTSAAAEAVRNLRTSILLSDVDRPPRVVMTTSSVPNEGKTTITIALAQNLAGLGKKVLLVEGDIRRRTFNAYFERDDANGSLLTVVSGKQALEEAVVHLPDLNIDVLMGDRTSINAADLFSSDRFHGLLEEARARYDYVVIDTPPVLVVPDARVIAQSADAVIYVVHWDRTSRTQVEEGLRQLRSVNAPVAGTVLSRIDPKGMRRYGYGGRYGAYSRYSSGYYEV